MTPLQMIEDFQSHLDLRNFQFFSGNEVMRRLHEAQQELVRDIVEKDPSFFVATKALDIVSGTSLYDLPANARRGARIIFTENTTSGTATNGTAGPVPPASLRDYFTFEMEHIVNNHPFWHFAFEGEQLRIFPTPGSSLSNAVKVWYVPTYGNMLQGIASAATSTTLDFYTSDPNYTQNYGVVDLRNDYYNGMTIQIISGTGAGQTRTITDYDGSNRRATVSAWTTTPVAADSTFAVMCPIPEDNHEAVTCRAAMMGSIKNRNRFQELSAVYHGSIGREGLRHNLMTWVEKRQDATLPTVYPGDTGA